MNTRGRVAVFQGVLTVAAEVGWLFPFSFQFFTRLAAVFAEEVGGFGSFPLDDQGIGAF